MAPMANKSLVASRVSSRACSGLRYAQVPLSAPAVGWLPRCRAIPEVGDLYGAIVGDQNIRGRQIAMNDSGRVNALGKPCENLLDDVQARVD